MGARLESTLFWGLGVVALWLSTCSASMQTEFELGMVVYTYYISTKEAETGKSPDSGQQA